MAAPERSAILPDVPSSVQAGMPDLQVNAWTAFFAPRATPQPVIERLNAVLQKAVADEGIIKRFASLGVDVPLPSQRSPDALSQLITSEFDKLYRLIQSAEPSAK